MRLKVVLLDRTALPLYLRPYHFLDVCESEDPLEEILHKLVPALKEPLKAQRHRFLNRSSELERIELAIDDSETSVICVAGFQGIGKGALLDEAIRRFFEGSDSIAVDVAGGTDLTELALKLNAKARRVELTIGLSKAQLEQELALSLETIARAGRFLVIKNIQHWLDEDARTISPLTELLSITKNITAFKDRPVFLSSTRKINTNPVEAEGLTQIFVNGLEDKYISTLIRLWYEITDGKELSHEDSLVVAGELHGHPIAAKLAAGLIGQYGIQQLKEFTQPLVQLRRDLARHLISQVNLNDDTKLLMESLAVARTPLPSSVLIKTLSINEDNFLAAVNQASQSGFLIHGQALEAHPLLLDYFWRTSWSREDYKPYAKNLAEAVWEYARSFPTDSVQFCDLLPICVRLYALSGDMDRAKAIRRDLLGELAEAAIDHYNRRNYDLAEQFIDEVLSADSSHWRMRLYKARVNIRRERWKEAENILRELLSERPADKGVLHAMGWRFLRARVYDRALDHFIQVIEFGEHVRSLRDAAECLYELGNDDEALRFLERAKAVESENPYVLDLEARIYEGKNEYGLAYEAAKLAAMRNPVDWSIQHRLGRIIVALGKPNEAIPFFNKAIELNQRQFTPRASLIAVLLDMKEDPREVREQLKGARRSAQTPSDEGIIANLEARCLKAEGKLDEAARKLEVEISNKKNLIHNNGLLAEIRLAQYYKDKDEFPASARSFLGKARLAVEEGLRLDSSDKRLNDLNARLPSDSK